LTRQMWPLKESAQPANLEKGYAALVTVTDPHITASDSRQRFAGMPTFSGQMRRARRRSLVRSGD
jgi:hypothetical protein